MYPYTPQEWEIESMISAAESAESASREHRRGAHNVDRTGWRRRRSSSTQPFGQKSNAWPRPRSWPGGPLPGRWTMAALKGRALIRVDGREVAIEFPGDRARDVTRALHEHETVRLRVRGDAETDLKTG